MIKKATILLGAFTISMSSARRQAAILHLFTIVLFAAPVVLSIIVTTTEASAKVERIICTNVVGGAPYYFYYDKVIHQMTLANNNSGIFIESDKESILNFSFINPDGTRDSCRIDRQRESLFCVDHGSWRLQGNCSFP